MITDIKFDCEHCGQKMVVDSSAEGLSTECPQCSGPIVIPRRASIHDAAPMPRNGSGNRTGSGHGTSENCDADSELATLRQELTDASIQITRLEGELAGFDKLKAEKRRLRTELTQAKKDLVAKEADLAAVLTAREEADNRAVALAGELNRIEGELTMAQETSARLGAEVEAYVADRAELLGRLEAGNSEFQALQQKLGEQEQETNELRTKLAETQAARTAACREVQSLESQLAEVGAKLAGTRAKGAELEAKLQKMTESLAEAQKRLIESEASVRSLSTTVEELRKEGNALRTSLSQDTAGKDLVVAREELGNVTKERNRLGLEVERLSAEVDGAHMQRRKLEDDLKNALRELDEARRRAEAASEHRLRQDNEVLRGIISRQNAELEQRHLKIVRLKRAQLGVRLAYAAFGIGLLLIAMWAIKIVPGLKLGGLF